MYDGNAFIPFVAGHGLIDLDLIEQLEQVCKGIYWNNTDQNCRRLIQQANTAVSGLNIYNIYDLCNGPVLEDRPLDDVWYRMTQIRDSFAVGADPPCVNSSRASNWLNQDSVRQAIHARSVSEVHWDICSSKLTYKREISDLLPVHRFLLQSGLRILIYSGDTDMCVPYLGSEAWTRSLDLPVVKEWYPWKVNAQVAGYARVYQQLTFATIKGSGHTVPQYKPEQALAFFSRFLQNQPL